MRRSIGRRRVDDPTDEGVTTHFCVSYNAACWALDGKTLITYSVQESSRFVHKFFSDHNFSFINWRQEFTVKKTYLNVWVESSRLFTIYIHMYTNIFKEANFKNRSIFHEINWQKLSSFFFREIKSRDTNFRQIMSNIPNLVRSRKTLIWRNFSSFYLLHSCKYLCSSLL